MDVYKYLEDFDNSELSESEWLENMRDKVRDFNEEFGTNLNPSTIVNNYIHMDKFDK